MAKIITKLDSEYEIVIRERSSNCVLQVYKIVSRFGIPFSILLLTVSIIVSTF